MKSRIGLVFSFAIVLMLAAPLARAQSGPDAGEWTALFNGQDLEDWIVKIRGHEPGENFADTFRVEDGLMTVSYDGYTSFDEQFGHIFYQRAFLPLQASGGVPVHRRAGPERPGLGDSQQRRNVAFATPRHDAG